ncbi:chemotaxis protein CheB [Segetibacter sp. 3557_3]|uniref:chemotaxis protein CheB n=1 Tax=Segetibacter sp. 3557_3 TaxID=2547429 RepID=UPI0010586924|nr:chemotaxis protein CheB [Segetibacter sp. 3557_3]TDH27239.1 chemotaxis protein CheB [Segetibacter sp. 3557_3]
MSKKFIVAIGASEGGLRPLTAFFDFVPHDQATYVILRHLPVDSKSQLQVILERHSKLMIKEVENGMIIEKDVIYMPPSESYITIANDRLYLQARIDHQLYPNRIIDVFLESLANAKGKFSVVVIMSGSGTDGVRGTGLIRKAGGLVVVQTLKTCEYHEMPGNVLNAGPVDLELNPADMPAALQSHINTLLKNSNNISNLKEMAS